MIEEGISGLLFQPDDGEELAKKILLLLADPVRAENMGDEAARRVRQYYSQEVIIPQVINVYRELVDKQKDCC
jgi:glycosyltransferase involved in cell wall biosynthesis